MSNNRKTYSFKAVGQLQNDFLQQQTNILEKKPVGIKTPIRFSPNGGDLFDMNTDITIQIRDNLKNLIMTNSGERLMLTDFGANIRPLALEFTNEDVVNEAIRRISTSVGKYMPYVELDTFENTIESTHNGNNIAIVIKVGYSIPSFGISNQIVEAVIYAVG